MADIYVPEDPQDKPFAVLSFSRQTLISLGFPYEQVSRLTDEDMARIAEILVAKLFDSDYDEEVKFTARLVLAGTL